MCHSYMRLLALSLAFSFIGNLHAATVDSDQVVVTASRFSESLTSHSVGVQIITADEISASGARSLPQLLGRYAGIYSRDNSGTADRQIDMRGFGANGDQNTAVILDGQRLNENELVTVKWSSIPLESIERIEILRGSGAVLFGGGATGGVIHIITKKPESDSASGYVQAGGGSDSSQKFRAGFSQAGDQAGLSLHASHEETDGYRDNGEYRQDNLEGSLRFFALPFGAELKFGLEDQHQGFPGARTPEQMKNDRRGTATPDDYGDRDGWHLNLLTQGQIGNAEWNLDIGHRRTERTALLKDYFFGIFNTYLDTVSNVTSVSPRIKIPHALSGGEDNLVIGVDYEDWDYDSFRGSSKSSPAAADISGSQDSYAIYALERLALTAATQLSLGMRWQTVHYAVKDRVNPADYANDSHDENEEAYEVGLHHALTSAVSMYAKAGRSFRLPTLDEVYSQYGGPMFDSRVAFLKPQTADQGELGIEADFGNSRFRTSIYKIRIDNEIHCMTTVAPGFCNNINLPPSARKGVEISGETLWTPNLELHANYTFADSEFTDGSFLGESISGNQVPLVPRHRANLGMTWHLNSATRLIVASQFVSDQRFDNDQTNSFPEKIPGYSVTDLMLEHEIGPWRFKGSVNNLFDKEYFSYGVRGAGTYNAYPEPERTLFFSGEYRWQ